MRQVGRKHGVEITFFHGRGGSIGRGSGPPHLILLAQPAGSLTNGHLRLTIQARKNACWGARAGGFALGAGLVGGVYVCFLFGGESWGEPAKRKMLV